MTSTTFELSTQWERPALPIHNGTTTLMIRIAAPIISQSAGNRRAALDLAFVIDRSGSMSGEPLELAKHAVVHAAGLLDTSDRAAVVVYDDATDLIHPLSPMTSSERNDLRRHVSRVEARGSTNLCDGWLTGCRELANHSDSILDGKRIRRALLLTDGLANMGEISPSVLCRHATELRRLGINTTTFGLGEGFDEQLLSSLAEAGGGNFAYLESSAQLASIFEQELDRLTTATATRLNVRLQLPAGLRGELLNPFPCDRHGRRFDIAIDDLSSGDELLLIFEITSRDLSMGATLPFDLSVRWTDPMTGVRRTESAAISPLDVVDERFYRNIPANSEVSAQTAVVRAAARQREAMELDRAGRHAESRAMHRSAFATLQAAPLPQEDRHLLDRAEAFASYDADIAFSEHDRKWATDDAFRRTRRHRVEAEQ